MMTKVLGAIALIVLVSGCASSAPPPPKLVDAFDGIYNGSSQVAPANASVAMTQPVGLIFSENVESHIGYIKTSNAYWGNIVPQSLTNTVVVADTDPLYATGKILEVIKRHFPNVAQVHDFPEAIQAKMKSVILVDLRVKWMEPYGDRSQKVDADLYFFDSSMNPKSKLNGHAEWVVPFASMDVGMQRLMSDVTAQLDTKMTSYVH